MNEAESEREDGDGDGPDSGAMRALLRRAVVSAEADAPAKSPDLLRGVHRKIRKRSRGKFFADGWSTSQSRINYALVAVVMLCLLAVTYFALGPMGFSAP